MKPRNSNPFRSLTSILSVALLTAFSMSQASAKTITWTGGYSTTGTWNQAANWGGDTYVNGDDAIFGNTARFSNFTSSGRTIKSITFTSDAPAYTISPTNNLTTTATGYVLTFINGNTGITVEAGSTANHSIGANPAGAQVGSIGLNGNLPVIHNGSGNLSLTRPVTGSFGIVKSGSGTLRLTSNNSYSGNTTINGGKILGVVGGHSLNSEIILNNVAATFGVSITNNTLTWTGKALTTNAAGTLEFNFGAIAPSTSVSPLTVTELADFTATPAVSVSVNSALLPGTYPLMTWGSTSGTAPSTANLTVSQIGAGTVASLEISGETLNLVISSTTPTIVKANNTNDLNLGSSWLGNVAPTAGDLAVWDNTVTGENTTVLGADLTWSGIMIQDPAGPVTINAGHTLTLGAALLDIDMSAATADLTLNSPLALDGPNSWSVAATRTLTLAGQVSGAFGVTKLSDGTAVLSSAANNYTGNTVITAGTLKLGASDVIPNGAGTGNVSVNGTLDLNGNNETINGLSGAGIIDNLLSATSPTLTVGANNQSSTFSGVIQNSGGALNLAKIGTGTQILGGANTFSGAVSVTGGRLAFSNTTPLDNVSAITMSAGTTLRPDVVSGVIGAPITLGGAGTTVTINAPSIVGAGGTSPVPCTIDSAISGAGNLDLVGIQTTNAYGTIILNAASDYEGSTLIDSTAANFNAQIFVRLGTENALPVTTVLTLDGGDGVGSDRYCQVDLKGFNQTLAGLTNDPTVNSFRKQQIINSSGGAPATLTINNSDDHVFSGRLGTTSGQTGSVGVNFALTKSGAGTLTLSGNNNYTGTTTITGGTLALGASTTLPGSSAVSIGAATLDIGPAVSASTLGTLEVAGSATISLGDATSAIAFGDSSSVTWTGSLTITGNFVSGTSLRFGIDANGLTSGQLAAISGPGLSDIAINSEGYITATVAASGYTTWAATNAGGQGPELDFDGDGVANGVEFFLNAAPGFTALPALDGSNTITWTNGGNIPASAYGSQFVVQTSANLVNWSNVLVGELTSNTDGPGGSLSYTLTGTAPRFVRLMVTPE